MSETTIEIFDLIQIRTMVQVEPFPMKIYGEEEAWEYVTKHGEPVIATCPTGYIRVMRYMGQTVGFRLGWAWPFQEKVNRWVVRALIDDRYCVQGFFDQRPSKAEALSLCHRLAEHWVLNKIGLKEPA